MSKYFCLRETPGLKDFIMEAQPLTAEHVPLPQALGRVCSSAILAPVPSPARRCSTRDGFAVHTDDVTGATPGAPVSLLLSGESRPGSSPCEKLNSGEAWRVYTGSTLPDGADAVIMQEFTTVEHPDCLQSASPHVAVHAACAHGENSLTAGSDIPQGTMLMCAGQALRTHDMALLAQFFSELPVYRLPTVGIISTGDEFCHAPGPEHTSPGGNIGGTFVPAATSNTLLVASLVSTLGAKSLNLGTLPDNRETLYKGLVAALSQRPRPYEVIVVIGGSSAGGRDYSAQVIASLPECRLSGQDQHVSSGRPLTLGRVGNTSILGFPGHSLSLALCAQVFLTALLRRLMGFSDNERVPQAIPVVQARLGVALPDRGPDPAHYPVMLHPEADGMVAWPVPAGTGKNVVLRDMDGWLTVPGRKQQSCGLQEGAAVLVRLFI